MDLSDALALILSAIATGISLWALRDSHKKEKRELIILVDVAQSSDDPNADHSTVMFTAANVGHRPVTIVDLVYIVENLTENKNRKGGIAKVARKSLQKGSVFPATVREGETFNSHLDKNDFIALIEPYKPDDTLRLTPVCVDANHESYIGPSLLIEISGGRLTSVVVTRFQGQLK